MERKDYLTTGELTQLMGITKHTLFHYDDIGLFQPKYINEKGYRFYSIDQIDILNTILVLRDLDMPLKEIQTYVSQRTPELFQQIFLEHEAQIAKQIKLVVQSLMFPHKNLAYLSRLNDCVRTIQTEVRMIDRNNPRVR